MQKSALPDRGTEPLAKGGFTVPEYETRVWDMARNMLHPTALYVVFVVAGGAHLLSHALIDEPGSGAAIEGAAFLAAFLGAWACFYSTLLRDAGLASRAITILVPLAALIAVSIWVIAPAPAEMSTTQFAGWMSALVLPGPIAWIFTLRAWRRHRAAHAALLDGGK